MSNEHPPGSNHLLAVLPEAEWTRIYSHLELVDMPLGQVVYESGDHLTHVYFPTTSIVSLLYVMENGASAEIAIVGKEGLIGVALFMGGETEPVQRLLLRYTQALITQMAQTAVCNRHHSIDQQLCRWLLLSLDCLEDNELSMTQELIANMLGVRRAGVVTDAAMKLQDAGLISYHRGHIQVLDRPGLEKRVCECYAVVRREFDRILPNRTAL